MSLGRSLELCGRKVLQDFGFAAEGSPERVVLSLESQASTFPRYAAILRAVRAGMVSAKARTMRYRFEVLVRSDPDLQQNQNPIPEDVHTANVLKCHQAFDNQAPAVARQHPIIGLFNAARTALGLQCTVTFVVPIGELEIPRKDRAFYDSWGYIITCAEGVSS